MMTHRQKKKNYKKRYGRNPVKDINGNYIFKYPPIIATITALGQRLSKGMRDAFEIIFSKL